VKREHKFYQHRHTTHVIQLKLTASSFTEHLFSKQSSGGDESAEGIETDIKSENLWTMQQQSTIVQKIT